MNQNLIARAIAIVLFGCLLGAFINRDQQKWRNAGRDQFLAHEGERFDKQIAPVHPSAMVVGAVIVVGFIGGLYEIVVLVLSAVLKSMSPPQPSPPGNQNVPFS